MSSNDSPIIKVKFPAVFEVVEDEEMIETIKEGKWIIIAIPIKNVEVDLK